MTYEEYTRLNIKLAYQEETLETLLEKKAHFEDIVSAYPVGHPSIDYWQRELDIINEVLNEKSYAPPINEEDVENSFLVWGF